MSIQESFIFKYCLSVIAACIAETVTYPLDLTKTRLQIQGEATVTSCPKVNQVHSYRGMLSTFTGIVREEGFKKLWHGVPPAIYRHVVYTGSRMSFYELLRERVLKKNPDGTFPVWKASLSGLFAGAISQFVASPTDLVKVRLQMEGKRRLERHPVRVKNTAHAFMQIVKEAGLLGLWKGCVPNVQRAALVNLGDLTTYDTVKHLILKHTTLHDHHGTHMLSSMCSGLVAALMGTPADVVKTRVMNQPTDRGRGLLYNGSLDCLMKTIKQEGFLALYKGLLPTWTRMVIMAVWMLSAIVYSLIQRGF